MRVATYVIGAGLAIGLFMPTVQSYAAPKSVTIRPIEEFVERQGTFCLDLYFNGTYVDEIVDGNFPGNCPMIYRELLA